MAPHTISRHRGGRPSGASAGARKKSGLGEDHIHKVKASEYNPDGYEWLYKGARVMLHSSANYSAQPSNPKRGSIFETTGVVTEVNHFDDPNPEHRPVHVLWGNGESNTYFFKDMYRVKKATVKEEKHGKLFNKNDVVLLKPGFFPPGVENPSVGCTVQCSGVVIEAHHRKTEVKLRVRWDNGIRNGYTVRYEAEKDHKMSPLVNVDDKDVLMEMVKSNPNLAYKITKPGQNDDYGIFSILRDVTGIENPDPVDELITNKYFEAGRHHFHIDLEDAAVEADEDADEDTVVEMAAPPEWHHANVSDWSDPTLNEDENER